MSSCGQEVINWFRQKGKVPEWTKLNTMLPHMILWEGLNQTVSKQHSKYVINIVKL